MDFTESTRIVDIMEAYPDLAEELMADERVAAFLKTPMAKLMLKTATIKDASRLTGKSVETLIRKLKHATAAK